MAVKTTPPINYPSIPGTPAWMASVLNQLANAGKLFGVTPAWLEAISEGESTFEIKGAGVNSSGYGGYFGLHYGTGTPKGEYVSGSVSKATLETDSVAALTHQAEVAAGDLADLYTGTPGKTTARGGFEGDTKYVNANKSLVLTHLAVGKVTSTSGEVTPTGTAGGVNTTSSPLTPGGFIITHGLKPATSVVTFLADPIGHIFTSGKTLIIRGTLILVGIILVFIGVTKLFGQSDSNPVTTVVEGSQNVAQKTKAAGKKTGEAAGMAAAA